MDMDLWVHRFFPLLWIKVLKYLDYIAKLEINWQKSPWLFIVLPWPCGDQDLCVDTWALINELMY
jgi:hypothetical protein